MERILLLSKGEVVPLDDECVRDQCELCAFKIN